MRAITRIPLVNKDCLRGCLARLTKGVEMNNVVTITLKDNRLEIKCRCAFIYWEEE